MSSKPELKQEDIILIAGFDSDKFTSTDNITNLTGCGDDTATALRDHIVELILYYEKKLRDDGKRWDISN